MKLNQKTITALDLPKGKAETIIFDEDLAGFGLRIRAGGKRTWIYQFKVGNQHRRMTLGSVTALLPAEGARDGRQAATRQARAPSPISIACS